MTFLQWHSVIYLDGPLLSWGAEVLGCGVETIRVVVY